MQEKLLRTREIAKILGVSWITAYRYINLCRKCGNYRGVCQCQEPEFIIKATNISRGMKSNWRISTEELRDFLERNSNDRRDVVSRNQRKINKSSGRNLKKKNNLGDSKKQV